MKSIIFHISNGQLFHMGNGAGIEDYFSSDKLYSALVNVSALIYEERELKEIINQLNHCLRLSSMYLGIRIKAVNGTDERKIFFVRKPVMKIGKKQESGDEHGLALRKQIKKIQYVSTYTLKEMSMHYDPMEDICQYDLNRHIIVGGKYAIHQDELKDLPSFDIDCFYKKKFIEIVLRQKNTLSRYDDSSQDTYYEEYLKVNHIHMGAYIVEPFFYFFIDGACDHRLNMVFHLLCDEGIGGKRSIGAGMFCGCEILEMTNFPRKGEKYITLSAVYPTAEDLAHVHSYLLEDRKGYVYSKGGTPVKKTYIRVIKEGSVFNNVIEGQVLDLKISRLSHPVYIYGKAFSVGFGGDSHET